MRVRGLLSERQEGDLPIQALIGTDPDRGAELLTRAEWSLIDAEAPPAWVRVSVALELDNGEFLFHHDVVRPTVLAGGDLEHRSAVSIPDDTRAAMVVFEALDRGTWGAGFAQLLPNRSLETLESGDLSSLAEAPSRRVRILPLEDGGTVEGRVAIRTEVGHEITKVTFFLDGEMQEERTTAPFETTVRLGRGGERHIVEAVAYDRDGREVGRDFLVLNAAADSFWVRITAPGSGDHVGAVNVEVELQVPDEETLDRVDYYWRNELIATSREAPHQRRLLIPFSNPSGFIRVEAQLASGRTTEDVVLMNSARFGAQVQVEVVELFVVVTDDSGQPVRNLDASAFQVIDSGHEQAVHDVRPAQDLPLTVGLAIDASGSLFAKLPRVQEAASSFVSRLSTGRDKAFLVGFGSRPRVVQSSTNNLNRVATSIGDLSAGGRTAVWEAITLSLLQLQDVEGRKAVVVFYDGDDEDEEFSYRTAFSLAKESGVPIYMIVMNNTAARTEGKGFRTRSFTGRLDRIARTGGGRVFYVPTDVDLEKIYAVISEELRSHYLITYSPEVETGGSVWRSIDVNVKGRGLHARTLSGYDPIRP
jgi:Ca-activated chloride channel family protein